MPASCGAWLAKGGSRMGGFRPDLNPILIGFLFLLANCSSSTGPASAKQGTVLVQNTSSSTIAWSVRWSDGVRNGIPGGVAPHTTRCARLGPESESLYVSM